MRFLEDISVQYVKGVGPARKKLFVRLGIESVEDLLYFFPRRYQDRRNLTPIAQVKVGEWQTVSGKILAKVSRRSWYTKKHVSQMTMDDASGRISCIWFNQPYLDRYFVEGKRVVCYGKIDIYKNQLQMVSPEYEILEGEEDESLNLKRIVPIYPLTRGVTQRYLRKTIKASLEKYKDQLREELPVALRNKHHLSNIKRSIGNIHFPESFEDQENALSRISFEEFYFFQISIILRRLSITQKKGIDHKITDASALRFINAFGFELTGAQRQVIREIRADMQSGSPMLRLLQGDVGSGKTLVALFGCVMAFENGHQACVMAPTEILARQHYENIKKMIADGAFKDMKAALFVSGIKKTEKDELYAKIENGEIDLVVGTHALINEEVSFKSLSFAVIDEQHKFGVRQRALLAEKGNNPDVLIMTATPIPRTLCITLYGDLDISIIDEMPPGRGDVKTYLYSHEQDGEVYELIRKKVAEGQQVYVIYPIIEESEKLDLKAAKEMFKHFESKEFEDLSIGLIHGQMKQKESREVMDRFKDKKIDILVATTVVEVGVDVPNANVMVIEHAERFGLAQLHQLRGRIGRGEVDGLCVLVAEAQTSESNDRLKAILSTTNGFEIAQHDLEIRGPGRFFGRHQHGLNELKVANPLTQLDILELARKEAIALTEDDPKLAKESNRYISDIIKKRYPTYLKDVKAG
ncbi:MAG: ATP-dependent DNA helicase RecG [Candidatus Omnitrophica bacterium]|nr:ATP-dependent DNA helicase RecG [Candidatus Omnitrophota bacterium]